MFRANSFSSPSRSRIVSGRLLLLVTLGLVLVLTAGCSNKYRNQLSIQWMGNQPRYYPLGETDFFPNKMQSRPLEPGTVARGPQGLDPAFYNGKAPGAGDQTSGQATPSSSMGTASGAQGAQATPAAGGAGAQATPGATATGLATGAGTPSAGGRTAVATPSAGGAQGPGAGAQQGLVATPQAPNSPAQGNQGPAAQSASGQTAQAGGGFIAEFPFDITPAVMLRGQSRYNAFCTPCHGPAGYGDGMIVQRGYTKPPSFHQDRLRQVEAGYFVNVIANGFGQMPDYSAQVMPDDRWAIAAYIRALQLSQNAKVSDLTPEQRSALGVGGQ